MTSFLSSAAKYYKAEAHQEAAWEALEAALDASTLEAFKAAYRGSQAPPVAKSKNPLKVPYFKQNDNASGAGYRECFSSSCAMLAAFYGKVKGDDEYNQIRRKYGDTTSLTAQLNALTSLGLKPAFATTGSLGDLKKEIDAGRPVAVGWLHKGHSSSPSGGGHWSVVIGYNDTHFILHDPNGEADLLNGGYVSLWRGQSVPYSFKNFLPRWNVEGHNSGWYLTVKP
jgi:hypothetical protein